MSNDRGRVVPLPAGPDHGFGELGRAASALLTELNREDAQAEIAIVYNVLPDAPGPAGYAVLELEDEMFSLAPSLADTFELLVHLANDAHYWQPTQVCRSARGRSVRRMRHTGRSRAVIVRTAQEAETL